MLDSIVIHFHFVFESVGKMHNKNKNSILKKESKELITEGKTPKLQCGICEVYFSAKQTLKVKRTQHIQKDKQANYKNI